MNLPAELLYHAQEARGKVNKWVADAANNGSPVTPTVMALGGQLDAFITQLTKLALLSDKAEQLAIKAKATAQIAAIDNQIAAL